MPIVTTTFIITWKLRDFTGQKSQWIWNNYRYSTKDIFVPIYCNKITLVCNKKICKCKTLIVNDVCLSIWGQLACDLHSLWILYLRNFTSRGRKQRNRTSIQFQIQSYLSSTSSRRHFLSSWLIIISLYIQSI